MEPNLQPNPLETDPIPKLIVRYAVPTSLTLMVNYLYNIVDQIFVGQGVGITGMAATNIAFPLTILVNAVALMLGDGCAANISLCLGRKEQREADSTISHALTLILASGLLVALACGIFALALHKKPERKHFWDSLVMMFGKHSFTILLLHWWVLYHIVIYTLNLDITWKQPLVFAGTVIFVILASFAYGFLIDQTVVYTIRACYEWMVKHIQRIYQK